MQTESNSFNFWDSSPSVIQYLDVHPNVQLAIKREDLLHSFVSGNKFRKLKYNIAEANLLKKSTLATFGGAFSNHIAAVAYVGWSLGFQTMGFVRGEELETVSNPTLDFARQKGMQLFFISRETYRIKDTSVLEKEHHLKKEDIYWIPEGGTNDLAVKGCEEILNEETRDFDFICTSVGTAGTMVGLINSLQKHQKVLGFPALKGGFLPKDICKFANHSNWELIESYHFGGYGKIDVSLITFINHFYQTYHVPLDPIYTGKMLFGVMDLIKNQYFPNNSKILIIHTGGLQGIKGMNDQLRKKNLPLIQF